MGSTKHLFLVTVAAAVLFAAGCTDPTDEDGLSTSTSTIEVDPEPTSTTEGQATTSSFVTTSTSTSTSSTSETEATEGCEEGGPDNGFVTGVSQFVNLRAEPSATAAVLAEIPVGSAVIYYPDSIGRGGDRLWVTVEFPTGADGADFCGSVAAEYIKDSEGKLVGPIDAPTFIRRAMFGLDPKSALATFTQINPDSPEEPFDDSEIRVVLAELRQIGRDHPGATVMADEAFSGDDNTFDGPGCVFGDGLVCQVLIVENDEVIYTAQIAWYGDGISLANVYPGRLDPP